MSIDVKVPVLPESVSDATVVNWHKQPGDSVARDENLVDLETDKVVLEVPAPQDGVLEEILQQDGATVVANDLLARIKPGAAKAAAPAASESTPAATATVAASAPAANASTASATASASVNSATAPVAQTAQDVSPAVRRLLAEHNLSASQIQGTGKDGRIVKEDVLNFIKQPGAAAKTPAMTVVGEREEKRVPMSRLRAKVAERLIEAQHNAAILTTFNEVNLKQVMDLRSKYKTQFEKTHGVKLGFMSFFTKAVVEALKRFPSVNASIDGKDIIYHGFYDVGIAVSTERGLVVPVLRDADKLSLAQIEQGIIDLATRARDGKLSIEEMQGGTFTITNGGVFGSLISTPIINPPQTGILGMHKIEERPVAENGEVVIRPMMYIALSYDHRIIDGKESVQFLATIKELLEFPGRFLLDV